MKLYDKIKEYLERGFMPIVKDKNGNFRVYSSISGELIRRSTTEKSLEECLLKKETYIDSVNEIEDDNKLYDYKIIGVHTPKIKKYKVDQKVIIRPDLADIYDVSKWDEKYKNAIGTIRTVVGVLNDGCGLYYNIGDNLGYFRHEWLLPVFEEERTIEDVLSSLSEEDKKIIEKALK